MGTAETTSAVRRKCDAVTLETQGHLVRLKIPGVPVGAGGQRGKVTEFSRQSRKRMLELLARIEVERAGFIAFVTLTYPDRQGSPAPEEASRDRTTFQKRITREYSNASAIWRREWEPRKSGDFAGEMFPHYHFLFFGLPFVPHSEINAAWREILGVKEYCRTEIKGVKSWRHALSYVGKYMAKVAEPPKRERGGPPVGCVASANGGEAAGSLVYGAYLTAEDSPPAPESVGRAWGVFNRKLLPFAEKEVIQLSDGRWVEKLRDLARRQWAGVADDPLCGFTLFTDNAEGWARTACALQEGRLLETAEPPGVPF